MKVVNLDRYPKPTVQPMFRVYYRLTRGANVLESFVEICAHNDRQAKDAAERIIRSYYWDGVIEITGVM